MVKGACVQRACVQRACVQRACVQRACVQRATNKSKNMWQLAVRAIRRRGLRPQPVRSKQISIE